MKKNLTLPAIEPLHHKSIFRNNNISAAQISRYLGFSYSHTHNILNGTVNPTPGTLKKLDKLVEQIREEESGNA